MPIEANLSTLRTKRKTISSKLLVLAGTLSTALLMSSTVQSHEPNAVSWSISKAGSEGGLIPGANPGGDDNVIIELFPNHRDDDQVLLVAFEGCAEDSRTIDHPVKNLDEIIRDPRVKPELMDSEPKDPRWRICPEEKNVLVKDHQHINVNVDFIRPVSENMAVRIGGKVFVVPNELYKKEQNPDALAKYLANDHHAAELMVDLYYREDAQKRKWYSGNFERIFGSASEGPKSTRDYKEVLEFLPVNISAYQNERKLPGIKELPSIKQILEDVHAAGSGFDKDRERNEEKNALFEYELDVLIGSAYRELSYINKVQTVDQNVLKSETDKNAESESILYNGVAKSGGQTFQLQGVFSTRWSADHALHPGFGFRVEAWTNETGSWKKLASDWVQWNGSWNLTVPSSANFQGNHLRVLYRSYNSYYRPQNQAGDTYSWKDPDQYNIGTSFNAGHRYADTDGGEYNGVGELVDAAMVMWSRLYWDASVNPVPADPIQLNYPNTWYDCGDGSGVPWSCATFNGDKIWLIASHGTSANVVAHELAHALQSKYWNKKWPANSGGSHTLSGCYPSRLGMALSEGFANFIPAWVGYPARNTAEGGFSGGRWGLSLDPERSTGSPNCSNGWENETWVARTFWDLHDTRADVDDILWFNHLGGVINIYLGNPVSSDGDAMDMRDFENIYRNAASSGHEGFISDIFDQNRM